MQGSMVIACGITGPCVERSGFDVSLGSKDDWTEFTSIDGGEEESGVRVNKRTALGWAPFWRAISLPAGDIGIFPIWINKRVKTKLGEGKERDKKHPANLINRKPNRFMTRFDFIRTLLSHAMYRGNGYSLIRRDGGARPKELLLLDPTCTWPVRRNGVLWYITQVNGDLIKIPAEDIIHIKGFGEDGLQGYDLLSYAKKTLGLALATREHRIVYFKHGAKPSVVLECPGRMPPKVLNKVKEGWNKLYSGVNNHHRTAVLQMGTSAKILGQTARDSQLIEGQELDVMHISALTGVPPHKIGGRGRQNYGSMEQENEAYMSDCISHWVTACEQEFADKLLTEKEKKEDSHTIEFLTQAKVKANLLTRYQAYGIGIVNQWLVPNDVRRAEGMNPMEGGDVPVNFQAAAKSGLNGEGSVNESQIAEIVKKILAESN